ncbi:MAG: hypothetical protein FWF28_07235 [Micrococcales bacterium]|nr:hypothetical protein [Micrococcales bacterium]
MASDRDVKHGCVECGGQCSHGKATWLPHGPVCFKCVSRIHYHPQPCPGCGRTLPLGYLDADGRHVCAACVGAESVFACRRCGSEVNRYFGADCARCILEDRLTVVMTNPATGRIDPRLQPVFDTMIAAARPRTTIEWLRRIDKPIGPGARLLRSIAFGELPLNHATFDEYPSKAANNLRDLFVSCGVLPPYQPQIARATVWLNRKLAAMPADQARVLSRYGHWHILRKARRKAERGTISNALTNNARCRINAAQRLMEWADQHHTDVENMTQSQLEDYIAEHPKRRDITYTFVVWLAEVGINQRLHLPTRQPTQPQVTIPDEQHWQAVQTLLADESITLYARVAGLFAILFAQPLCDVVAMTRDQITQADGKVFVAFDSTPVEMPEPLDQLIIAHLAADSPAAYQTDSGRWLFQGRNPGRPLATESIRSKLAAHGIHHHAHRNTAMFSLAARIPAPVLADLIGVAPKTAVKWAALSARDWSGYIKDRAEAVS